MFCIVAFPLGDFIRNMNILLADILLVFILYISLYKGIPPRPPAPPTPPAGPLINVMKGFCRLTKIFQAFWILEGILELWLGKKSFVLEMWQIFLV